jgi:hypothetical protein
MTPLRSNARGADHRKHRSSIIAHVSFRENVFTEPLHSSELFRLSGFMSKYHNDLKVFLRTQFNRSRETKRHSDRSLYMCIRR